MGRSNICQDFVLAVRSSSILQSPLNSMNYRKKGHFLLGFGKFPVIGLCSGIKESPYWLRQYITVGAVPKFNSHLSIRYSVEYNVVLPCRWIYSCFVC